MRKEMKMRAGGAVKKYQRGGSVDDNPAPPERGRTMGRISRIQEALGMYGANPAISQALLRQTRAADNVDEENYQRRRREYEANAIRRAGEIDATGTGAAARGTPPSSALGSPEDGGAAANQRNAANNRRASRPARARPRARSREMSADDLNDMSLALIRRGNMGPNRAGAESNIARAMGYKKGGIVGKPAGIPKAPKVPGRAPGRPASGVKPFGTKPMAKAAVGRKPVAMPAFKKGGKVSAKKGKK
jgi:hypothetical protein